MKFTIRDMFLVTMIVALAVGWWLDRSRLIGEANKARNAEELERDYRNHLQAILEKDEGYTFSHDKDGWVKIQSPRDLRHSSAPAPNPPKP